MRFGIWLFLFALVVRLVYVWQGYDVPPQDTRDYDDIAMNLLAGEGFVARENWYGYDVRSWRAPFYPFFLAGVYGLFGDSHEAVRVIQCLIGAGTVALLFLIGKRLTASGWAVGVAGAVYGPLVAISNEVMTETWFTFWFTAAVYALLESEARRCSKWGGLGGGLIGLAALTRPVGLLLLPAYVLYAWPRSASGWRPVAIVAGAAIVTVMPWITRNYVVHDAFPIFSTHGGFILLRSNRETPDWRRADGWQIPKETFENEPSEIERDRAWFQQGKAAILDHPGRYLRWCAEKLLRFWYVFRPSYNFWFVLVLPFFVAGLIRHGWEKPIRLPTLAIVVSVAVFVLILYGSTRFRLPLEGLFLVYAVAWCSAYVERVGLTRAGSILTGYTVLNLVIKMNEEAIRACVLSVLRGVDLK